MKTIKLKRNLSIAHINTALIFRAILLLLIALTSLSLHAQPVSAAGKVMFVTGTASLQTGSLQAQPILRDVEVRQGDRLSTASDGYLYIRMADGALLVLRPNAILTIDHWQYDATQPEQSLIKYTLQQGVSRYVSGKGSAAAKDMFRFNTPMAAIGVRGTDFTVLATPELTQVSVRSGGVIVSPFDATCSRNAIGPCEGSFATELFATDAASFLQLRNGEQRPQRVLLNGAQGPDQTAPALSSEPIAQKSKGNRPDAVEITSISETNTDKFATSLTQLPGPSSPPKDPPLALWGRWGNLSAADAATYVSQLLQDRSVVAINPDYVLASNPQMVLQLPESGVGQFKLDQHEGLYRTSTGAAPQPTQATAGQLSIDFNRRQFQTELQLSIQSQTIQLQSRGTVDAGNLLQSTVLDPATSVKGIVGGSGAGQAAYIYRSKLLDGAEISGATSWSR